MSYSTKKVSKTYCTTVCHLLYLLAFALCVQPSDTICNSSVLN